MARRPALLAAIVPSILVSGALVAAAPSVGLWPLAEARSPSTAVAVRPRATIEELGRMLFWDPILSGPMDVACATCHHPEFAYADGRALALGTGSAGLGPSRAPLPGSAIGVVPRNAPTLLNVGLNGLERRVNRGGGRGRRDDFGVVAQALAGVEPEEAPMFWDSRVRSLELQALEPLKVREEMRGDAYPVEVAVDSVVARLRGVTGYVMMFGDVFGIESEIQPDEVAAALAAFQRTLMAVNSPFDRYQAGDLTALTAQQIRGMNVFEDVGCTECHDGPMLSDFELHAEGVAENPLLASPDVGNGRYEFRTPSLRNVALTAPYMHGGVLATLRDVLDFYDEGESQNPNVLERRQRRGRNGDGDQGGAPAVATGVLDGDFRQVDGMTGGEREDIIAFLESLTDPVFDRTIPAQVPSGLPPGGAIAAQLPR